MGRLKTLANRAMIAMAAILLFAAAQFEWSNPEVEAPDATDSIIFGVDRAHSRVSFRVRHLGIANVRGHFNDYDVTVHFNPEDLASLQVEAIIEVASINTGIERRDNHLRSDDFFNAEAHPTMTFVSKAVRNINGEDFELVGDLTIRDVTKEVVLNGTYYGSTIQREKQKAGFEARGTINRFDYNLRWDNLTEAGGLVVGEDVQIILEMELEEA